MKSLLAKLSPRRALGIYVGEDEIAVSQVAATLLGPVEIYQHRERYQPDELLTTLQKIIDPLVGKRRSRRRLVAFGLPLLRIFFSTRPLKGSSVDVSPKVILHEVLRSPNSNVEEMAIDVVHTNPGKRPVVHLASCRKKYLGGLLANLRECDIRPYRVEPSPCALMRAAEHRHKAPRKAKTIARIFLGPQDGLAILSAGGWPVVPRSFRLADSDLSTAIISIVRTLETLGKLCGTDSAIDAVLIHGTSEARDTIDLAALGQQLGVVMQWHEGPSLDNGAIAFGSALGCLKPGAQAFDLARSMKPRESLWELFPWFEFALQMTVVICLALFLMNRSQELDVKYSAVRSETDGRHWLKAKTEQQLSKEKTELEQRVEAVRKFLATRVLWTAYTHDIPARLPANATLNSFLGQAEIEKKGANGIKPKRSFVMRIGAPIAQDGAAPKEIDGFLDSLRENELLKRDFPLVDLADIKWFQPFVGAQPTAFFTIVCLPKSTKGAAVAEKTDQKAGH